MLGNRGQAIIESTVALALSFLAILATMSILIQGIGTLILKRWAHKTSVCVAKTNSPLQCKVNATYELGRYFKMRDIWIKNQTLKGEIIMTEISAHLIGPQIKARYDLGASEYRRVSKTLKNKGQEGT